MSISIESATNLSDWCRETDIPTLEAAVENVGDRAGIEDNPRDVVRTSVIDSDETEAAYVEMLLFDPPLRLLLVLRSPQSTEFRVQTADGEKRLATGRDFQTVDPGSRARLRRGESGWRVLMVLKSAARPEWRSTLRQFDVLSNPDEHPLRVYSTETQLAEITLTPEFAALVRSGDWTGEIGWPADSRPTANQVRLALERPYRSGSLTSCG